MTRFSSLEGLTPSARPTCSSCLDDACACFSDPSDFLSHPPDPIAQPVSLHRMHRSGNLFQFSPINATKSAVQILKFIWICIDCDKDADHSDVTTILLTCALWSSFVWIQASESFVTFFAQHSRDMQIGASIINFLPFLSLILLSPSLHRKGMRVQA